MLDPDHYIAAENDRLGKKPSLDLLERAARLAGFEFEDFIREPDEQAKVLSREHDQIHRQLQDLLDRGDEAATWMIGNIRVFHKAYFRRR